MLQFPKLQLPHDLEMDFILINKLSPNHSVGWAGTNSTLCDCCQLCPQTMAAAHLGLDFWVIFAWGTRLSSPQTVESHSMHV